MEFPNFDPVLIQIGPLAIRWYALAYVAGILLGWRYVVGLVRNERLWGTTPPPANPEQVDDLILWITLGIILGGRLGYVLFYDLSAYLANPMLIFEVWKGGMSFHGGFLGCVLAVVLFGWKRNISIGSLGDLTCAAGPIGIFLGRLANFINSELWGRPAPDVPWSMVFPNGGPIPRHPSQLYEAAMEGALLFVLLYIAIRMGALRRPGLIIGLFAMFYAVLRSCGEFFREPDAQLGFLWGGMTMGMVLSVPLFLAGVGFAVVAMRKPARTA